MSKVFEVGDAVVIGSGLIGVVIDLEPCYQIALSATMLVGDDGSGMDHATMTFVGPMSREDWNARYFTNW